MLQHGACQLLMTLFEAFPAPVPASQRRIFAPRGRNRAVSRGSAGAARALGAVTIELPIQSLAVEPEHLRREGLVPAHGL